MQGQLEEKSYFSTLTKSNRKFMIYTPPGYERNQKYPVLYLLHGIGGTHKEWLEADPCAIIDKLINNHITKPMIVVMPNGRSNSDDTVPKEIFTQEHFDMFDRFIEELRIDLMPYIEETYLIAEGRENRAIAGLSMGGREALFIGLSMPETFSAIGAFSPAPGLLKITSDDGVYHKGQMEKSQLTLPKAYKNHTFVMICHGDEEPMFKDIAEEYRTALDHNRVDVDFFETAGGHDFRTWRVGLDYFVKRIFK